MFPGSTENNPLPRQSTGPTLAPSPLARSVCHLVISPKFSQAPLVPSGHGCPGIDLTVQRDWGERGLGSTLKRLFGHTFSSSVKGFFLCILSAFLHNLGLANFTNPVPEKSPFVLLTLQHSTKLTWVQHTKGWSTYHRERGRLCHWRPPTQTETGSRGARPYGVGQERALPRGTRHGTPS